MPRFCATDATPAVRQPARPTSRYSIGVMPLSVAANTSGWSASKVVSRLVVLLLAEAEVVLDGRRAVHAVLPRRRRPPGELGRLGRALQHLARVEQRLNVDPVVGCSSLSVTVMSIAPSPRKDSPSESPERVRIT